MFARWIDAYPIVSIEDPFAENDIAAMRAFTNQVGHRVQLVGDDFLVTSAARVSAAAASGACNTVLIKPNQVGSFSRSERMAKWNESPRIEESLGSGMRPYLARRLFKRYTR